MSAQSLNMPAQSGTPHHQKNIQKLEMVQRRAARFVTKMPHRSTDGQYASVSARIQDMGWKSLQERRKNNRLVMMYRIVHNLVEIPPSHHPTPREYQPARGNQNQFTPLQPEVEAYNYAFLPRTIVDWNQLDLATVSSESLDTFKRHLY